MSGRDTSSRQLRVFLCHSTPDKPQVRKLYARLQQDGYDPWLDEKNLIPGQDWQEEISKAIRACDVVLVCLSQGSVTKDGFVNKEIKFALDRADEKPPDTIFIIPACLEKVQAPERLKRWQWVNLFEEDGYQKLLSALTLCTRSLGIGPNISYESDFMKKLVKWGRWGGLLVLLILAGMAVYRIITRGPLPPSPVVRITNSGNAITAAISADEKYVAYAAAEKGRQALRVHDVTTATEQEIIPPADGEYAGITFSKDNFIYYVLYRNNLGTLYRISILGGQSQTMAHDVDSAVSFSPDGKWFAFRREDQEKTQLLIHDTQDSSHEQVLKELRAPEHFWSAPLWSPKGDYVVCEVWNDSSKERFKFMSVRVTDGQ